jgi:hypothetical protein
MAGETDEGESDCESCVEVFSFQFSVFSFQFSVLASKVSRCSQDLFVANEPVVPMKTETAFFYGR